MHHLTTTPSARAVIATSAAVALFLVGCPQSFEEPECVDLDGDGYGIDGHNDFCPTSPETDCNDTDSTIHPGAAEACDGVDNDCDGSVPDDEADHDGDGVRVCDDGSGLIDCDDQDNDIYPGNTETTCNDVDDDCDANTLDDPDVDGDGVSVCGSDGLPNTFDDDCNDNNDLIYPGADEVCNGEDDDCDDDLPTDETDDDTDVTLMRPQHPPKGARGLAVHPSPQLPVTVRMEPPATTSGSPLAARYAAHPGAVMGMSTAQLVAVIVVIPLDGQGLRGQQDLALGSGAGHGRLFALVGHDGLLALGGRDAVLLLAKGAASLDRHGGELHLWR